MVKIEASGDGSIRDYNMDDPVDVKKPSSKGHYQRFDAQDLKGFKCSSYWVHFELLIGSVFLKNFQPSQK